jgi:hypothetical protein
MLKIIENASNNTGLKSRMDCITWHGFVYVLILDSLLKCVSSKVPAEITNYSVEIEVNLISIKSEYLVHSMH